MSENTRVSVCACVCEHMWVLCVCVCGVCVNTWVLCVYVCVCVNTCGCCVHVCVCVVCVCECEHMRVSCVYVCVCVRAPLWIKYTYLWSDSRNARPLWDRACRRRRLHRRQAGAGGGCLRTDHVRTIYNKLSTSKQTLHSREVYTFDALQE